MEDTPITLGTIVEQARDWNFNGDFRLLQWMNRISQNLDYRATQTAENLDRLNNNVKSTHVALDNVSNSLTALQFGNQFVECRVQDDDETTICGGNEELVTNGVAESSKQTPNEALITFLDNNLKVLRNCHEKYSIDLDDSDEEDEKIETTYVFQPINPYNEKPLPHIIGSKEWNEKWHVGLACDYEDNSFSGDEISDAYSESSSCSPPPDNESYETNSEFASSLSLNNDNFAGSSNFEKNINTLRRNRFETVSETSSSHSSAVAKISNYKSQQQRDVNEEDTNAASSSLSSSQSKAENISKHRHENTNAATMVKSLGVSRSNIPPFMDLFSEPPDDLGSKSSTPSLVDYMLHKPVNIFNEKENIHDVNKELAIEQKTKKIEAPVARERSSINTISQANETPAVVSERSATKQNNTVISGVRVLPPHQSLAAENQSKLQTPNSAKNLFDDDDQDEEDFLSAFVRKQETIGNPKLIPNPTIFKEKPLKKHNTEDLFSQNAKQDSLISQKKSELQNSKDSPETKTARAPKSFVNLFDDIEDESLDIFIKKPSAQSSAQVIEKLSEKTKNVTATPATRKQNVIKVKSTNLFDDDNDDDDDFFKTLPRKKEKETVPEQSYDKNQDRRNTNTEFSNRDQLEIKEKVKASSAAQEQSNKNYKSDSPEHDFKHSNVEDFLKNIPENLIPNAAVSKQLLSSVKDTDNDRLAIKQSSESSIPKPMVNQYTAEKLSKTSNLRNNLFDEDTDEDFFKTLQSSNTSAPKPMVNHHRDDNISKKGITKNNLFDEDTDDEFFKNLQSSEVSMPNSMVKQQKDGKIPNSENNLFDGTEEELVYESSKNLKDKQISKKIIAENLEPLTKISILKPSELFANEISDDEDFLKTLPPIPAPLSKQQQGDKNSNTRSENLQLSSDSSAQSKDDKDLSKQSDDSERFKSDENKNSHENTSKTLLNDEKNYSTIIQKEFVAENKHKQISSETEAKNVFENVEVILDEPVAATALLKENDKEIEINIETPRTLEVSLEVPVINKEYFPNTSSDKILDNDNIIKGDNETHEFPEEGNKEMTAINTTVEELKKGNENLNQENTSKDNEQTQKYGLSSSFLFDEPPDDDDNNFFESLGKSSSNQTASNSFDIGHDLYTAEPQVAKATIGDISSLTYTGLQLFDEVPPEDDEFEELITQKPETTKRFNTIFYDDLHETLEALNGSQQHTPAIPINSYLNTEPPPMVVGDELSQPDNDVVDFLKNVEDDDDDVAAKASSLKDNDVKIQTPPKKENEDNVDKKNTISKMNQLPKLNINVQALLPSGGTLRKDILQNVENKENKLIPLFPDAAAPSQTSHILPNVTKNRVRAPSNRKPSSRKFRQENYQKTLLNEELLNQCEDINKLNSVKQVHSNLEHSSLQSDKINKTPSINIDLGISREDTQALSHQISDKINHTKDDDECREGKHKIINEVNVTNLFSPFHNELANKIILAKDKKTALLSESPPPSSSKAEARIIQENKISASSKTNQPKTVNVSSVFTESESDDDLFSNFSAPLSKINDEPIKIKSNQSISQIKPFETRNDPVEKKPQTSLFGDESDEENDLLKSIEQTKVIAKNKPKSMPQSNRLFSDTDDSDDDDLFSSKSKVASRNKAVNSTQKESGPSKPSAKETIADNPLADLL